jgi:hypothetical protein
VLLASSAIGLLAAAAVVPEVSLSLPGFIIAVTVFAVTQSILSMWFLKSPRWYVPLFLGSTGLALTTIALILASIPARGLKIEGTTSWLATTILVWLVTTIGAVTLPELLIRDGAGPICATAPQRESRTVTRGFGMSSEDGGSGHGRHA